MSPIQRRASDPISQTPPHSISIKKPNIAVVAPPAAVQREDRCILQPPPSEQLGSIHVH